MIYRIVYCSRNRITGNPQEVASEIAAILSISRKNNVANDVTGALLFNGEAFAQVLEGPRDAVDVAYAKIRFDLRHSDVVVLQQVQDLKRSFGNWTMAYSEAQSALQPLDFDSIAADPEGAAGEILQMLKAVVDAHVA